jgi:Ser/Thr protein kinase RdoA (MazF antagonist)
MALGLDASVSSTQITTGFDASVWKVRSSGTTLALRLLRPGTSAEPELAAARLAADRGLPVPRVIATGRYDGCDAVATTWCPGRTIGELLTSGGDAVHLGRIFGRAHAQLHEPGPDGSVLCHLDFQPFNVLTDGQDVTGIVDWTNARLGDACEDIAQTAW